MRAKVGAPQAITPAAPKLAQSICHLLTTRRPHHETLFAAPGRHYRQPAEPQRRAQAGLPPIQLVKSEKTPRYSFRRVPSRK